MRTIDYITYNDVFGGIYQSQVIDVVEFLNQKFSVDIRLIAFVPFRLWREQKKLIKEAYSNTRVYPVFGLKNIRLAAQMLKRSQEAAICRGPLAVKLARKYYRKIIYDARAAVGAEAKEYNVGGIKEVNDLLKEAERFALRNADGFIAVSTKMKDYWKSELNIESPNNLFVIPCTLTSKVGTTDFSNKHNENNWVNVVYAGGTGPWQSFERVVELFDKAMSSQRHLRLYFLTREHSAIDRIQTKYAGRVERKWLKHTEVAGFLENCDYGILIRDDNWTNRVASPVKFAEYLHAGLQVLISENLGDFSEVVEQEGLGIIVGDTIPELKVQVEGGRLKAREYCRNNFFKEAPSNVKQYQKLIQFLNE